MGSKNIRNDMLDIFLHTDEVGNPQSVEELNEPHVIVNSCIMLDGVPDSGYGVTIDTMTEINIKKRITDASEFKVNYKNGRVYFHSSREGENITVDRYYSRGILKISATRVYFPNGMEMPTDTELQSYIDDVKATRDLDELINTNEVNRQTQETNRQTSEVGRNDAENLRVTEFQDMRDNINIYNSVDLSVDRSGLALNPITGQVAQVNELIKLVAGEETEYNYASDLQISDGKIYKKTTRGQQLEKMIKDMILHFGN